MHLGSINLEIYYKRRDHGTDLKKRSCLIQHILSREETYASPERGGAKTNVANDSREHLKRARGGDISREDVAKMKTYGFRNVP